MTVYRDGAMSISEPTVPAAHDLAGSAHLADTLADLNTKVSDFSIGGPVTAQASTPLVLVAADSGKRYSNEGAAAQIVFNLPTAVPGLEFEFFVQDANGIQVVAAAADTIRDGATVSAAAGNIASVTVGDTLRLKAINATEWLAVPAVGTWTTT